MRTVYLVWQLWPTELDREEEEEILVGVYIDRPTAEYAVNGRDEYRIERRYVRAQDRRLE